MKKYIKEKSRFKCGTKHQTPLINRRKAEANLFFSGIDTSVAAKTDDPIAPYPRPSGNPLIQKGSSGPYVKWVQYTLSKQLGYDVGSAGVDGDFGAGTESAVKAFQKDNGLEVDGQVGPKTIKKIVEKVQSKKWYEGLTPANLGNSFDAIILNKNCWKPIRPNSSSNVFLYKEEWITSEMWRFTRQSNGSYRIVNFANGQSLDAYGAGTTNGTNVGTYNSNDSNAQRWFIYGKNGGYVLRADCGDLVMDVEGNISADNTNIQLYTYHGGEAQVFSLYHSRGNSTVSDYAKPSPSAPTLSVKSAFSIALSWKSTAYTEKYIVYRSTDNSTWKKIGETTSPSYTDNGLTAATKYYYKFESVNRFYTVSSPSASAATQAIPTYTVAFNSNSGSGTMSNQTINRDKATALTANAFTRAGYTFLGWSTDKNATKPTYTDKQSVTNLTAGGGSITLYAVWQAMNVKITLIDELRNTTDTINTKYGDTLNYKVLNLIDDSIHLGWSTQKNGLVEYRTGSIIKPLSGQPLGNMTLYSRWAAPKLRLKVNGKESCEVKPGETITLTVEVEDADYAYCSTGIPFSFNEKLQLVRYKGLFEDLGYTINIFQKSGSIITSGSGDYGRNGVFAEITFKVPEDANSGEKYSFDFMNENNIYFLFTNNRDDAIGKELQKYASEHCYGCTAYIPEFSIEKSEISLQNGQQYTIKTNEENITYKSNNTNVAVVSKKGVVTAVGEGNAVISVINSNSEVVQLKVNVKSVQSINGDCNNDGVFNITDAVLLQKWLLAVPDTTLQNWKAADLCEDGKLDVFDLILMKKMLINN